MLDITIVNKTVSIVIILAACGVVFGLSWLIIRKLKQRYELRCERIVSETSELLARLVRINKDFNFNKIQQDYIVDVRMDSKPKYDRFDIDKKMIQEIKRDMIYWRYVAEQLDENQHLFIDYIQRIKRLKTSITAEKTKDLKISYKKYIEKEEELFELLTIKPVLDVDYRINVSYTSPQGRNSYKRSKIYNITKIMHLYKVALDDFEKLNSKDYQRRILTPSMRYDVMKRDDFKCVICGRSVSDGVKLEVDHIVPVSKGGKTEMKNLRTLCRDCNRGKSAKYDEQGIN